VLSVPACDIAPAYLSACKHAASSQPHFACFDMVHGLPQFIYDPDSRLNDAAEASQVDLYRPHGCQVACNVSKDSAVRFCSSALFQIPSRLALSFMWSNLQYLEGSTVCTGLRRAGICTTDCCRAASSIASCLLFLQGSQAARPKQ
jgi:hypothetical protein